MAHFGELLAELREDYHMTQVELAKVIHVSKGTICNYENGVHYPELFKLMSLADFFGVTTDYLLGRCASIQSADVLGEEILPGKTADSLLKDIRNLSSERKYILGSILDDMKLSTLVGNLGDKRNV